MHTGNDMDIRTGAFTDRYGVACSIQMSSLGSEACIWLGVDDPKPQVLRSGIGWRPVDLDALVPGRLLLATRMHLTQEMARELATALQHFAETGELP